MMTRQGKIDALRKNPDISVLIIGAGINGIGTFRDLALQNVDVLLVDKGDFCAGASAASSHMLHGGIRYLENGEFRLVREALHERNLMLENAPHYARPLRTTIPIYKWFSGMLNAPLKFLRLLNRPGERGAVVIKAGLVMYDWFVRKNRRTPTHQFRFRSKSLAEYPFLNPEIKCTATYYDAWMPTPERICIELILDAEAVSQQAYALNYMPVVGGAGDTVTLQDAQTGETVDVRPKVVVNAAGPWIDFVNRAMKKETRFIGGTKGSHLIIDHPQLYDAANESEVFFENKDGRIVLILPFVDGRVMVGTTDIRVDDPEEAVCTEDEIQYMLELIGKVFPTIKVERSQIVFHFCGVRPLPSAAASYTGQISRDHSIEILEPGQDLSFSILSLIGGKWTTFRAFSEQAADLVLKRLGKARQSKTTHMPIGGGKMYPEGDSARKIWLEQLSQKTNLPIERAVTLFERYGTRAQEIAQFIAAGEDAPLQHKPDFSQREVIYIAQQEQVVHLSDFVLRRSLLAMLGYLNPALIDELAGLLADVLNWSESQKAAEIEHLLNLLREKHGVEYHGSLTQI